jgi:hypothetical protein
LCPPKIDVAFQNPIVILRATSILEGQKGAQG